MPSMTEKSAKVKMEFKMFILISMKIVLTMKTLRKQFFILYCFGISIQTQMYT